MGFYKKSRNAIFVSIIFLLSFVIRLCYLPPTPLSGDEAVYAEIIEEFTRDPTLIPHFMGHNITWKPMLGFAVYSALIYPFRMVNPKVPFEVAYRMPSLIFGVLSALAVYLVGRKLYNEETALLSSLIFTINPVSIVVSENLLLETPVLFLLVSGLILYMDGERDRRYMYYAGLVGALLFLTKSIIAFLLPALAIAYYFGNKKIGDNPEMGRSFLVSLSGIPLAMILYSLVFFINSPIGKGGDITVSYIYDIFFRVYGKSEQPILLTNTIEFLKLTLPWSIMFFAGLLTINLRKREDRFIYLWLVLMLVFLGAVQFYSWYYLIMLPPFSILCSKSLMQIRNRRFLLPVTLLFLLLSIPHIANPAFMDSYLRATESIVERTQVGFFLRDKTNILSITQQGIPETVFYKFHGESAPDYPNFEMRVLDPFSPGSYIAYKTVSEIALGMVSAQNITDSQVKSLIVNSSNNAYVVMDSKVYGIYSPSPLSNYRIAFNSSQGSYVVLEKLT